MFITPFYIARIENTEELLKQLSDFIQREQNLSLDELFLCLSNVCSMAPRPVVLLIDEVDHASNHPVFIDFLAMLRGYYLNRENMAAFHSVILAGAYDIKKLKLKIRSGTEHRYNSPWNIGARFNIDMSFTAAQIAAMLKEYENDQRIGINPKAIAEEIYRYTSGYPYLVSSICKWLDEELPGNERFEEKADAWTKEGIMAAVKGLLDERIPLFESMVRQLDEYPEMKRMLHAILFEGRRVVFNINNPMINLAAMFGYIVNRANSVQVANRIFEICLYNLFLSEDELASAIGAEAERNYYIEAQTRDARRTDVIVDYLGEQFVIEIKLWRGAEYNERGQKQLTDYLDYYHLKKGYLLSFNFNKKKETGIREFKFKDRTIIEALV